MNLKDLCDAIGVDAILGLDWETYYDNDYSLKKMATTEYIVDPRFKMHMVSAQWHDERQAAVLNKTEFKDFAAEVDWKRTALLAHHTHFDGFILSHHYKHIPAFYLDTLSMANILMPVNVPGNLDSLARALGLRGKVGAQSLENVKGVRDLSPSQFKALARYAGNDIEQTFGIAKKLIPCLPLHEIKLIDLTIKMYARPTVLVDKDIVDRVNAENIAEKAALVTKVSTKRAPVVKADLVSNDKFAALLRAAGVEPPTKLRPKYAKQLKDDGVVTLDKKDTSPLAFAFSKGDLDFKELLKHPDRKVRELVQARLANKTSIVETRSARMGDRSVLGPQPIYLKHAGAKTLRWSGGDKCITGDTKIQVLRNGHGMTIRLDNLRDNDRVWDGEAYVSHGGLAERGTREVLTYEGVTATPEHKVFVVGAGDIPVPLDLAVKHGMKLQRGGTTASWQATRRTCQVAKDRCTNKNSAAYPRYGERGITFGFTSASMMAEYIRVTLGPRPSHRHSIDRIDNNLGYAPGNLQWATHRQQNTNKREYANGVRIRELHRQRPDLCYETIRSWVARGMTDAEIVNRKKTTSGRPRTAKTSLRVGDSRHAR